MRKIFLALISIFFIFSCTNISTKDNGLIKIDDETVSNKTFDLINTSWKLTDISGNKVSPKIINGKEAGVVTLDITGDKISGNAGVNRYFGTYALSNYGRTLTLRGIGSTKMFGDQELMERENKYLSVLGKVTSFQFKDTKTLVLKAGSDTLTFTRVK